MHDNCRVGFQDYAVVDYFVDGEGDQVVVLDYGAAVDCLSISPNRLALVGLGFVLGDWDRRGEGEIIIGDGKGKKVEKNIT